VRSEILPGRGKNRKCTGPGAGAGWHVSGAGGE